MNGNVCIPRGGANPRKLRTHYKQGLDNVHLPLGLIRSLSLEIYNYNYHELCHHLLLIIIRQLYFY